MTQLEPAELEHLVHYGNDDALMESMDGRVIGKLCAQVMDLHESRKWVAGFSFLAGFLVAGVLFVWILP